MDDAIGNRRCCLPWIDECVITSSKYHDILKVTLPFTLQHVRKPLVVTSTESFDDPTREVCRYLGVRCVSTGLFYRRGSSFSKGAAINRGLDHISQRDWVLHMDGDIVLPDHTSHALARLDLDTTCIYGIDRVACPNAPAFRKWLEKREPQFRWSCLVETPREWPLMGRYIHTTDGYCPIGFFQLWHGSAARDNRDLRYPEDANNAVRTDVQHSLYWDGHKRRLIPDIIAIHLDSCDAPIGANWNGRKTPPFDLKAEAPPSREGVKSFYDPTHERHQADHQRHRSGY